MARKKRGQSESRASTSTRLSLFNDTPAGIKALRKSYKDHRMPDLFQLKIDLSRENDRSSIILMASILDNALATRIAESVCFSPNNSEFDYIFRFEGPMAPHRHPCGPVQVNFMKNTNKIFQDRGIC